MHRRGEKTSSSSPIHKIAGFSFHASFLQHKPYLKTNSDMTLSLTLVLDTPSSPFSFVSTFVQERNSIPNSSKEDQSLINQHLASATVTPSSDECCDVICFAMALILHFGGAMRLWMVLMKSGLYLRNTASQAIYHP